MWTNAPNLDGKVEDKLIVVCESKATKGNLYSPSVENLKAKEEAKGRVFIEMLCLY